MTGSRRSGVDPASFTRAAREGVTRDGHVYALPFDNWAPLWQINMNLFRAAGLVRDGKARPAAYSRGAAGTGAPIPQRDRQSPTSSSRW